MRSDAKPCSRLMRQTAAIFTVGGALGFWVLCRLHYGNKSSLLSYQWLVFSPLGLKNIFEALQIGLLTDYANNSFFSIELLKLMFCIMVCQGQMKLQFGNIIQKIITKYMMLWRFPHCKRCLSKGFCLLEQIRLVFRLFIVLDCSDRPSICHTLLMLKIYPKGTFKPC